MTTFADLGLPATLTNALGAMDLSTPTEIQRHAIPLACAGESVIGRSITGSGKTLAFALPLISRLSTDRTISRSSTPGHPRGLILAPTRELATQITTRIEDLAAAQGLRCLGLTGGVSVRSQRLSLAAPVDIAVATPARLLDLTSQRILSLNKVESLAIDEADQLIDAAFFDQLSAILNQIPAGAQRLVFSATLDETIRHLAPGARICTTGQAKARSKGLKHYVVVVDTHEQRDHILQEISHRRQATLIFASTKALAKRIARTTGSAVLHGDKTHNQRTTVMEEFRSGAAPVLVTTDVAARGIDISEVSLVVQIGTAFNATSYIHRAGRTARAGAAGASLNVLFRSELEVATAHFAEAGVHPIFVDHGSGQWNQLIGPTRKQSRSTDGAQRSAGSSTRSDRRESSRGHQRHNGQRSSTHRYAGGRSRQQKKKKKGGAWSRGSVATPRGQRRKNT